jgi:hypothetical protein
MRRFLAALVMAALLIGLVVSSVSAYYVTTSLTVNGKTTGPVAINLGGYATSRGSNYYNVWVGPIPIPSTAYVWHSVAYTPFAKPVIVGGNQPIKAFSIGTNPLTGSLGWNYSNSFTVWTEGWGDLDTQAKSDTRSSGYYNSHGTGTGHMTDSNRLISVKIQ